MAKLDPDAPAEPSALRRLIASPARVALTLAAAAAALDFALLLTLGPVYAAGLLVSYALGLTVALLLFWPSRLASLTLYRSLPGALDAHGSTRCLFCGEARFEKTPRGSSVRVRCASCQALLYTETPSGPGSL